MRRTPVRSRLTALLVGSGFLVGATFVGLAAPAAQAAPEPRAKSTGSLGACQTGKQEPRLVPSEATPNAELTQAWREFGNTGGGWSNDGGWAASDGMYSTELPGHRVAWLLNDTFHGPVNADESLPRDVPFVHNSIVLGGRDGLPDTTVTRGTHEAPLSLVGPTNTAPPWDPSGGNDYWYWNGDGIVDGGKLRIFESEQEPAGISDPHWNFQWVGTDIATLSTNDFTVESVTPTYDENGVSWGVDLMRCGGYTYIYGQKSGQMHLARARAGHLVGDDWQFYAGDGWTSDPTASTAITTNVGSSYSVTPMDGQFVLTTGDAWLGDSVYVAVADAPTGPFTGRTNVYTAPEPGGNIYAPYNIAAHPTMSEPGTLTISYNVNSQEIDDLYADANNNRPRFVDIHFSSE